MCAKLTITTLETQVFYWSWLLMSAIAWWFLHFGVKNWLLVKKSVIGATTRIRRPVLTLYSVIQSNPGAFLGGLIGPWHSASRHWYFLGRGLTFRNEKKSYFAYTNNGTTVTIRWNIAQVKYKEIYESSQRFFGNLGRYGFLKLQYHTMHHFS